MVCIKNNNAFLKKREYTYDSQGRLILWLNLTAKSSGGRAPLTKYEYSYNGDTVICINSIWNNINMNWELVYAPKTASLYDKWGNKIMEENYTWNATSAKWVGYTKFYQEYDSIGNITVEAGFKWNSTNNKWDGYNGYEVYSYDRNRKVTCYILKLWETTTSEWVNKSKEESHYNIIGDIDLKYTYRWDITLLNWVLDSKKEINYNSFNKKTTETYYSWNNISKTWSGSLKNENIYDEAGKQLFYNYYWWDSSKNSWSKSGKKEYSYSGNTGMYLGYAIDMDSIWSLSDKGEYIYDQYNNIISDAFYNWRADSLYWIGINKSDKLYDENNNIIQTIIYSWNNNSKSWVNSGKGEYGFDNEKRTIQTATYNWDALNSKWVGITKTGNLYDQYNNKIETSTYKWDGTTDIWYCSGKTSISFDSNNRKSQLISQSWSKSVLSLVFNYKDDYLYDNEGDILLDSTSNWNSTLSEWTPTSNYRYYYSLKTISDIYSAKQDILSIYPNPVRNIIYINKLRDNSVVRIYDSNGKIMNEMKGCNGAIDVSEYTKGLYLVKVTSDNETKIAKFIKIE
jgi:hypothetical protein